MPTRMLHSGAGFLLAFDAAQEALRAELLPAPLLLSKSPQQSEGAASVSDTPITCPTDSTDVQESAGGCLLQCLYMAGRCDRRCAGCIVTAAAARREGAPLAGKGAAGAAGGRQSEHLPDGNHGESLSKGSRTA